MDEPLFPNMGQVEPGKDYPDGLTCCRECGSLDVEVLDWVHANSNRLIGGNDGAGVGSWWCPECEDGECSVEPAKDWSERALLTKAERYGYTFWQDYTGWAAKRGRAVTAPDRYSTKIEAARAVVRGVEKGGE